MRKRIIVTGASKGVGNAVVKRLLRQGHTIIATARTNSFGAEEKMGKLHFFMTDLAVSCSGIDLVDHINKESLLPIDGFVHCAGIAPDLRVTENERAKVKDVFEVNALSFFDIVQSVEKWGGGVKALL